MKTSLFLVSLLFGGSLFAQTAAKADLSNSMLKKFNEEAKQQSVAPTISFMENKGQFHDQNYKPRPDVLFGAMAGNMTFHLKTTGVSYQLNRVDSYQEVEDLKTKQTRKEIEQQTIYRVDLSWLNANTNLRTTTDETLKGFNNYYLESCPNGALNVKSYTGVTVHNLYNGINLHYYEKGGQLKHDYIVAPGANYQQIQLKVEGATVRINEDGSLTLTTPLGKILEGAPIVFQNGKQLKANWSLKNNTLGFEIENYNPNQELIIDPVTRAWGTYYGGTDGNDFGASSCTDTLGNVYLAGRTASLTNIATAGTHQSVSGGSTEAFLVKFNSNGLRQWATYYGGSSSDIAADCCTDSEGNIYLAGGVNSNTNIATVGSHQSVYGGSNDAFLVKFNSSGVRQWGTYYGGAGADIGRKCATDLLGNVYLSGYTYSSSSISSIGAHQTVLNGSSDAFLVKFNSAGAMQWGTYYGGAEDEEGISCATDAFGNVYLAGITSSAGTVIATAGSHQTVLDGFNDAFLVKFNSAGARQWGTYYGGAGEESGNGCATDPFGNVYMSGYTYSSTSISSIGAHQTALSGTSDAFLVKFNSGGAKQWATYYGGTGSESGNSCSTDAAGNIYLAGTTDSNNGNTIATSGSFQAAFNGFYDAYLVKFSDAGLRQWGTYYGGTGNDEGYSCFSAASGNVYLVGHTGTNTGTAIASPGSHQPTHGGGLYDCYLVKFNDCSGSATENQTACDSYTWPLNGITYTSSGSYTHFGTSTSGCPSTTTTLNLTINSSTTASVTETACDSYTWPLNGTTYTSSGTYTHVGTNASGCPLTTTLNLTINNSTTATVTETACDSYTWTLNGTTYTTSGTYTHVGTNAAGCPLTTTLNLTINSSTTASVTETACDSYTWPLTGMTYTTSGNYTHVGTNANGCPLTTTLNLTINNSTTATVNQTACDSYTWPLTGTTYTTSGTYTHVGTNANGCPLTTTLNLTINNSTTATVMETACDSFTWALNGTTYTTSGTYTHVGTNASGCPLTTTLNLTINNSTTATVTETACDSYTWALNGTTYTSSGTYTHVGTNGAGCQLTTTLNLTINSSSTANVTETACDSYTWTLNGTTYTTSGTYTHVGTNAAGCPLTTTLNLTINSSTTASVPETACDSYTWSLNGTTYTSSGTYTHVGTNASGCPLTTTLNLTINTVDVSTTVSDPTITANASGAGYQWINCNNGNAIIPGATAQAFTPTANGNYAVIVTQNGCSETSNCVAISTIGIEEIDNSSLVIYPNPSNDVITISSTIPFHKIELMNALGQVVGVFKTSETTDYSLNLPEENGVYLVKIYTNQTEVIRRIVKR